MTTASHQAPFVAAGSEKPVVAAVVAPVATDRPTWLKPNFKDGEQLAQSYDSLLAEFTKLKQGTPEIKVEAKPPTAAEQAVLDKAAADKVVADKKIADDAAALEAAKTPEQKAADKVEADKAAAEKTAADALAADGIDVDAMSTRFWEKGEFVAEDKTKLIEGLTKLGFKDAEKQVDAYAAAQIAAASRAETDTYAVLGGKEAGQPIIDWAIANLTPAQKAALQPALNSGDVEQATVALTTIKSIYEATNGKQPELVLGGGLPGTSLSQYNSQAEVTTDMSNPLYRTDPAYRAEVMAKLGRSTKV